MLARRVDALILASSQAFGGWPATNSGPGDSVYSARPKNAGLSAILWGLTTWRREFSPQTPSSEIGCKTIAHIGGSNVSYRSRSPVWVSTTLAKRGNEPGPEYTVNGGHGDDAADATVYNGMKELLKIRPGLMVFCCNDPIAMGAMRAILEAGCNPRRVAVIGWRQRAYDDLLRFLSPASIRMLRSRSGSRQLGLGIIKSKTQARKRCVPDKLVIAPPAKMIFLFITVTAYCMVIKSLLEGGPLHCRSRPTATLTNP